MAVSSATELKILVKTAGEQNLNRLSRQLEAVGKDTASADFKFDKFSRSLRRQEQQATKNISNLRTFAGAWRELANSVDYTSAQFREANREAQRLERQLAKTQQAGRGGGLARVARTGGAIAAAGIFGGPEGALGAGIGAIAGGPVGAAVGGAIGAQVGQFRQQLGATATYAADLQKQRIALAGLTRDYAQYQNALERVERLSQQFQIPQEIITRQFTKLAASVIGAGGSLDDTEKAFKGVAAGIRGTGGDLQDLSSALTATAQVFSKGKVSAEELRQQIGERLPGAFTLFAQSLGMTPAELDKALEDGKVSLQDFQKFSELLFEKFGKSSEAIVNGPAAAGERLQVQLSKLSENVGKLLAPIGAAFQNVFTEIIRLINGAAVALNKLFKIDLSGEVESLTSRISQLEKAPAKETARQRQSRLRTLNDLRRDLKQATQQRALLSIGAGGDGGPTGLPGIDTTGGGAAKSKKKIKVMSDEIYAISLRQIQAQKEENNLLVAQLNFEVQRQTLKERLVAKQIDQKTYDIELQKAGLKLAKDVERVEDSIQKKLQKQTDFRLSVEAKIQDALFAAENLNEEELKRIQINRTLAGVIEQAMKAGVENMEDLLDLINRLREAMEGGDEKKGFKEAFKEGIKSMGDLAVNLGSSLANAFVGASDALADFISTGKADFKEFARSVLQDLTRIFIRYAMFQTVKSIFKLDFSANGNVMTSNGPMPLKKYANGGIARSPQISVFGEGSTPEAYVPLPDGRSIPVTMKNKAGEMGNVVVNVDASGSKASGDSAEANRLGEAIGLAVKQELIKQKRPGGLLA